MINVNDYLEQEDIFQIQLNQETLIIKKIGKSSNTDDLIIAKNIGKNKNICIHSVVYSIKELDDCQETGGSFDLLKLYDKENNSITYLSVMIDKYKIEENINDFKVFMLTIYKNKEKRYFREIEKKINKKNIVEKIILHHLESLEDY